MRTQHILIAALVLGVSVYSFAASSKKKSSDSDSAASSQPAKPQWHKIKSSKADAKTRGTLIKFQPTTDKFRVTIVAKSNTDGVGSTFRAALMEETARDQDGVPKNWKQVQSLTEGEPKNLDPIEFTGGLDQHKKPRWFAVSVTGQKSHYEVVIEDLGDGKSSKDSQE
jgi:cell division septation protein DedD